MTPSRDSYPFSLLARAPKWYRNSSFIRSLRAAEFLKNRVLPPALGDEGRWHK
jgi:hypothetical protein